MKKLLAAALLTLTLGSSQLMAGFSVGLDTAIPYGYGPSVGYSFGMSPFIELGVEYSSLSIDGSFKDPNTQQNVNAKLSGQRYGISAKLNLPLLPLKLHLGNHSGSMSGTTAIEFPGTTQTLSSGSSITGTYFDVGLEYKIAFLFVEPRIGVQTFTANGTNYSPSFPSDLGLKLGIAL